MTKNFDTFLMQIMEEMSVNDVASVGGGWSSPEGGVPTMLGSMQRRRSGGGKKRRRKKRKTVKEGIEGTRIADGEMITSCGVRNRETDEVIPCEWHAEGWEEAEKKGWMHDAMQSFGVSSVRAMTDEPNGYDTLNKYIEDGFLTTKGRFLSRVDALKLARQARQVNKNRADDDMWNGKHDPYLRSEEINFAPK